MRLVSKNAVILSEALFSVVEGSAVAFRNLCDELLTQDTGGGTSHRQVMICVHAIALAFCPTLRRPSRLSRYNRSMLRDLRPLFAYMRRYRWGYVWGSLSVVATNAVYVLFPKVLERAIDELSPGSARVQFPRFVERAIDALSHGIPRERILVFAGMLVAIGLIKGVF